MTDELSDVLDDIRDLGYEGVTPTEGFENEASGAVPLPEEHRRDRPTGWRRHLPRIHRSAGDPALVPADLRSAVESHGWTVQAMGRDDETVTVVVSPDGV